MTGAGVTDEIPWAHTPFEQRWWLEAVAPGQWGETLVERQGKIVARLPWVRRRKLGVTVLTQPPLTRFVGPWIQTGEGKYETRLVAEHELMAELIARLPRFDSYRASLAPAITNWLPFYWAGFDATVRYTYRLDDLSDPDRVWNGLRSNIRNHVRRASRQLEVRTDLGVDEVLTINRKVFARQGLPVSFSDALAHRLDHACRARRARSVLAAVDADGRVHAAWFFVHDATTTYLLFGGGDPELRSSGANSLVVWEAIRRACETSQSFDFLGSMIEPIERFNRAFGARQVPYFFVSRTRPHARLLFGARDAARLARALTDARRRGGEESTPTGEGTSG
ncbi:acetyltransferase (GNAT) family protein [Pseudonocardia hierapolitana]|uniref:Acetyltransferase (GNAT) family protein n=1 Tax=Pseudonocardia hierapolitana TaxID=1128676 RepID=A0A561SVY1_9PSEU|nr:GNAT family N-acetyltransferase [Pseudonocardia hierapolitana]TWF79022.1 acetyltransferase (GNAT) family protein [Pseudonocardia hierapolitana]